MLKNGSSLLNEVESPLQMVFLQLPHGVFFRDLSNAVVASNEALHQMTGQQLDLESCEQLQHPDIKLAESSVLADKKPVVDIDVSLTAPSGASLFIVFECLPWFDNGNALRGTIGILRDVTAARAQENALIASRDLLQFAVEQLPMRVFWKDTELTYLGCNSVFANDMGLDSPEQLIGNDDYATVMTREEADICRADDFDVLRSGVSRLDIEEVIGSESDKLWIRVSKVPLRDAAGELIGVLGIYQDIQEQKESQLELENALIRERELNEMKTNFVSTVSHEYRNPLAVIATLTSMILRLGDKFSREQITERLEKILNEVRHMTKLMDNVLFIGREELQVTNREYVALDMAAICADAIDGLNLEKTEVDRIRVVHHGQAEPLIGLPMHLSQLLQNLLSNALKYSDGPVDLNFNWDEASLNLSVTDQGIGIPEDEQPFIFESFYRGNNVGTITGNGLGLFIVKRAVLFHDGTIALKSSTGEGTTIEIVLPYRPKQFNNLQLDA